ncbi:hypothetical protein F2P81_020795 [Scophthalmus maximus]|uniref:Uncharacterized protein n=1 Tax=Scophthalmus maximus TaxID=52904 RepID=A0A6A4S1M8_SCOMX|nr:hypothetical protein F2P81_020795 [Scophthalmus maximus]
MEQQSDVCVLFVDVDFCVVTEVEVQHGDFSSDSHREEGVYNKICVWTSRGKGHLPDDIEPFLCEFASAVAERCPPPLPHVSRAHPNRHETPRGAVPLRATPTPRHAWHRRWKQLLPPSLG